MADRQTIDIDARAAAAEHMRGQRWSEAADALASIAQSDAAGALQLNVCRNLASLREHRPRLYATLVSSAPGSRYTIGSSAAGHPTLFYRPDSGAPRSLSPGNDPIAALSATFASIKQLYQLGQPMALLGIGDGYLIKSCALHPPKLDFGSQQPVYLFEPDEQALLAALMIHDYSGPQGPIEQPRFAWCIGPDWLVQARELLIDEPYHPPPAFQVTQSAEPSGLKQAIGSLLESLYPVYERARLELAAHCSGMTSASLAQFLGPNPPRPPRALLITTRRSTVLQYSTRDTAEAFGELGWETRVVIEPEPYHVVTPLKLSCVLRDFKPDLVFQIDHVRQEWGELIPPQLPFVCWIQDHMTHLASTQLGLTTSLRDFLLCGMPAMYVERYSYPKRQFLKMPKLTKMLANSFSRLACEPRPGAPRVGSALADGIVPARCELPSAEADPTRSLRRHGGRLNERACDLVYVSTASGTPQERVAQIIDPKHCTEARDILAVCCQRMIDTYAAGDSLPTIDSIRPLLEESERATGHAIGTNAVRQQMLETLFDRLNNVLYRQQAIRWAANVADRHGLTLALYGAAWERNPEFARFARGPVAYGRELEAVTRGATFNLVLEPTLHISHQRLLDALAAGGFCLIRRHPADTLFGEVLDFLARHTPESARTIAEARAALSAEQTIEFDSLLHRCEIFATHGDIVACVRDLQESRVLLPREAMLPHLEEVTFDRETELEQRVIEGLADEDRRRRIATSQRGAVAERFSYTAGIKRMVDWIRTLVLCESSV
jgi:hypothetical protein